VKEHYNKNYNSLKKEIEEDGRRWKDFLLLIFMPQQNQYYENDYTESNLYFQCNSYQNSNDILHRDRKLNPKFI
jgi:hypothetical protein